MSKADEHAAACDRSWALQDKANEALWSNLGELSKRVVDLERRVAVMAAIGGLAGAAVGKIFGL